MAPKYLIASYPKSGNHWVRYITEWLTHRPTLGTGPIWWMNRHDKPIFVRLQEQKRYINGRYRASDAIAIKRHRISDGNLANTGISDANRKLKLILIVRNYKEVMVRFGGGFRYRKTLGPGQIERLTWYAKLLELFDDWQPPKLLIYYEDLILKPYREINKIVNFLADDALKTSALFMQNYQHHKNKSLKACGDQVTRGKHVIYHSKILTNAWSNILDNYLKEHHNRVFDKYLSRYL